VFSVLFLGPRDSSRDLYYLYCSVRVLVAWTVLVAFSKASLSLNGGWLCFFVPKNKISGIAALTYCCVN
jgi:hypothetical protein